MQFGNLKVNCFLLDQALSQTPKNVSEPQTGTEPIFLISGEILQSLNYQDSDDRAAKATISTGSYVRSQNVYVSSGAQKHAIKREKQTIYQYFIYFPLFTVFPYLWFF